MQWSGAPEDTREVEKQATRVMSDGVRQLRIPRQQSYTPRHAPRSARRPHPRPDRGKPPSKSGSPRTHPSAYLGRRHISPCSKHSLTQATPSHTAPHGALLPPRHSKRRQSQGEMPKTGEPVVDRAAPWRSEHAPRARGGAQARRKSARMLARVDGEGRTRKEGARV